MVYNFSIVKNILGEIIQVLSSHYCCNSSEVAYVYTINWMKIQAKKGMWFSVMQQPYEIKNPSILLLHPYTTIYISETYHFNNTGH